MKIILRKSLEESLCRFVKEVKVFHNSQAHRQREKPLAGYCQWLIGTFTCHRKGLKRGESIVRRDVNDRKFLRQKDIYMECFLGKSVAASERVGSKGCHCNCGMLVEATDHRDDCNSRGFIDQELDSSFLLTVLSKLVTGSGEN